MAYNENGQYYFDPTFDEDDREALGHAERTEQALFYRQQQRGQQQQQKFFQDSWKESLEAAGLSQQEYDELHSLDPSGAAELLKGGMKLIVGGIASRKKGKPQAKPQTQQGRQPAPQAQREPERSDVLQGAREKVNKGGTLTEADELDILGAVLGSDFKI